MANTTNIDLVKPAGTDYALVSVLNSNSDKIDAEAGKVRANFAGTYSTSSAYAVGAYCIYQGNLYRCKTAIGSGGEAWTSGHWDQVSVGTELTTLNNQIQTLLTEDVKSSESVTVGANTYKQVDIDVTKSGYTPVGVVGYSSFDVDVCCISSAVMSATSIRTIIRNLSSSAKTGSYGIRVLYKKN